MRSPPWDPSPWALAQGLGRSASSWIFCEGPRTQDSGADVACAGTQAAKEEEEAVEAARRRADGERAEREQRERAERAARDAVVAPAGFEMMLRLLNEAGCGKYLEWFCEAGVGDDLLEDECMDSEGWDELFEGALDGILPSAQRKIKAVVLAFDPKQPPGADEHPSSGSSHVRAELAVAALPATCVDNQLGDEVARRRPAAAGAKQANAEAKAEEAEAKAEAKAALRARVREEEEAAAMARRRQREEKAAVRSASTAGAMLSCCSAVFCHP